MYFSLSAGHALEVDGGWTTTPRVCCDFHWEDGSSLDGHRVMTNAMDVWEIPDKDGYPLPWGWKIWR